MTRSTKILNVSLDPVLYDQITETAKQECRTKSDLIREAFRTYAANKEWSIIRKWGSQSAQSLKIKDEIDIDNILHDK